MMSEISLLHISFPGGFKSVQVETILLDSFVRAYLAKFHGADPRGEVEGAPGLLGALDDGAHAHQHESLGVGA